MILKTAVFFLLILMLSGCSLSPLEKELATRDDKAAVMRELKTHYQLGERHYKAGQFEEAVVEFEIMLSLKSEEENALYRLGTIAFKQGRYEDSAEYFERAITSNPKNKKAHFNLASIRLMQAENHFKYYAALVDKDTDLKKVSKLVADIDHFNRHSPESNQTESLDKLAGALKSQ